jgi:hypothetical protein
MKRKSKRWWEKVDESCLNYLRVYQQARNLASKVFSVTDIKAYVEGLNPVRDVLEQHPEVWETRKVSIKPEFAQQVQFLGMIGLTENSVLNTRTADILEMAEVLTLFDTFPPEQKLSLYLFLAMLIVSISDSFKDMKQEQFGEQPLDDTKFGTLAAQFCEAFAQAFRGRLPRTKGKYNVELLNLVKKIHKHQKEALTPKELREAVAAAGITVPEGEAWRIWLWRARRAGRIPEQSEGSSRSSKKSENRG